jgi:hypothetical protein
MSSNAPLASGVPQDTRESDATVMLREGAGSGTDVDVALLDEAAERPRRGVLLVDAVGLDGAGEDVADAGEDDALIAASASWVVANAPQDVMAVDVIEVS